MLQQIFGYYITDAICVLFVYKYMMFIMPRQLLENNKKCI